MQLKWYLSYWVNTTKKIDYGIRHVISDGQKTSVVLERIGEFPMPVDLLVTYADGSKELYYIPMNETLGNKPAEETSLTRIEMETWNWVEPTYTLSISKPSRDIVSMEIDPSMRMADVDRKNNQMNLSALKQP
ncbi:MAG: M1 family peptidase, partial [Cyclobacteriaceae bacterium]|nr:M1 family peptidase [Cyclobacteriaceae bacterium]